MNRKIWSNEEKATIVMEMIRGEAALAVICNRHCVSATQAYRWQEQFLAGGRAALADKRIRGGRDPMADENRRLKELAGQQALIIETQKKLAGISPRT